MPFVAIVFEENSNGIVEVDVVPEIWVDYKNKTCVWPDINDESLVATLVRDELHPQKWNVASTLFNYTRVSKTMISRGEACLKRDKYLMDGKSRTSVQGVSYMKLRKLPSFFDPYKKPVTTVVNREQKVYIRHKHHTTGDGTTDTSYGIRPRAADRLMSKCRTEYIKDERSLVKDAQTGHDAVCHKKSTSNKQSNVGNRIMSHNTNADHTTRYHTSKAKLLSTNVLGVSKRKTLRPCSPTFKNVSGWNSLNKFCRTISTSPSYTAHSVSSFDISTHIIDPVHRQSGLPKQHIQIARTSAVPKFTTFAHGVTTPSHSSSSSVQQSDNVFIKSDDSIKNINTLLNSMVTSMDMTTAKLDTLVEMVTGLVTLLNHPPIIKREGT